MPSPQQARSNKRSPLIRSGSSSSSVGGLERIVPPFQSFVKQTPPVERKPLPPPPVIARRASSISPPRPRTPPVYATRRSSSVYSRSVSQFGSDNSSWRSADFAEEPLPPLPTLLPVAYSASTPQLVEKQPTPPLLQPRTYSPLIHTPSPTASRTSTRSPAPQHKPSILLPLPPVHVKVPKKHLRTVSLEKAKAELHAPGAVHLLPEELRAQTLGKSKSHEAIKMDSINIMSGSSLLQFPEPSTLVDNQGRRRTLRSPSEQYTSEYPFPNMTSPTRDLPSLFSRSEPEPPGPAQPTSLRQQRKASQGKVTQTLGVDDVDDQRGRRRTRGPRHMEYPHYLPNNTDVDQTPKEVTDAQEIAQEYHSLLTDQYRSPASSPSYYRGDSDESVKSLMKMVPKPLFQTKPPAKLPGTVTGQRKDSSWSPYRLSDGSEKFGSGRTNSSGSSLGPNPFESPRSPASSHKRRSTSGSIPISPPSDLPSSASGYSPRGRPIVRQPKASSVRRGSDDNRVSAFYPHIAPRKKKKAKTRPSKTDAQSPPVPLLSADVIAQRLMTPQASPTPSPPRKQRPAKQTYRNRFRTDSNASSDGGRTRLHERFAKGAAKYADLLTKPSGLPERQRYRAMQPAKDTAPVSPHLLPSPVKAHPARIHLGWSDQSKSSHDTSRSLVASPRRLHEHPETPRSPQFTHVVAPARPLDERADGLRETEVPRRKGSIFGTIFDGWKEDTAEKRREELKKTIRVVPNDVGATKPTPKRRASTFGWM